MAEATEIEITAEMVAAGMKVFAAELHEVEETLKNSETAALVGVICRAMLNAGAQAAERSSMIGANVC